MDRHVHEVLSNTTRQWWTPGVCSWVYCNALCFDRRRLIPNFVLIHLLHVIHDDRREQPVREVCEPSQVRGIHHSLLAPVHGCDSTLGDIRVLKPEGMGISRAYCASIDGGGEEVLPTHDGRKDPCPLNEWVLDGDDLEEHERSGFGRVVDRERGCRNDGTEARNQERGGRGGLC